MIDDVIGLIMVQVISNLGGATSFNAVTVVRPIGVSIGFAVLVPIACTFLVKPVTKFLLRNSQAKLMASPLAFVQSTHGLLLVHTAVLIGIVTASSYAGTSNLFAAYLAGVVVTWSDGLGTGLKSQVNSPESNESPSRQQTLQNCSSRIYSQDQEGSEAMNKADNIVAAGAEDTNRAKPAPTSPEMTPNASSPVKAHSKEASATGLSVYHTYYHPITTSILKPFFFASIGFSIPISQMFIGHIVWRGFVYAILMTFGKLLCGICLIRFSLPIPTLSLSKIKVIKGGWADVLWTCLSSRSSRDAVKGRSVTTTIAEGQGQPVASQVAPGTTPSTPSKKKTRQIPKPPRSLYPASILGAAMVARGEIGFLVSSIAQSNGIFQASGAEASSDLFLVVTWAILICTVIGPVAVGLMVKRVRGLQEAERTGNRSGREDPLGVWGVVGGK
jgi:Kef-type K+ transport system membrane component KefB